MRYAYLFESIVFGLGGHELVGAVELLLEEVEVELEEERFEHFLDVLEVNSLAAIRGELRLHDGRLVGEKAAFDGLFLVLVQ
jgi:hypothetical protein|tara:strand:+ start:206 stop:451 length:246 start_codon:yes stop_codon:yes gene_type:complete